MHVFLIFSVIDFAILFYHRIVGFAHHPKVQSRTIVDIFVMMCLHNIDFLSLWSSNT